jgi:hypothetical protein
MRQSLKWMETEMKKFFFQKDKTTNFTFCLSQKKRTFSGKKLKRKKMKKNILSPPPPGPLNVNAPLFQSR